MKRFDNRTLLSGAVALLAMVAVMAFRGSAESATVGTAAPLFTLVDSEGKTHDLSEYRGKYVVLEWLNHGCPFVLKHYSSGNMQRLQKKYTGQGVVWLSIISSAPGKQGYSTPEEANEAVKEKDASPTAVLFDSDGTVGRTYGARTTPHMFVVDPEGTLIYNGAIDDRKSTNVADIEGAKNYVATALDEAMSGRPVTVATSQPYGCSVKY
jgi:peroxiredoxin